MEGHKPIHQMVKEISSAHLFIKEILNIGQKHNEIQSKKRVLLLTPFFVKKRLFPEGDALFNAIK
jgi:hypothetical protein